MGNYIGTLPGWLTLLTLGVVGFLLYRGGSGHAVSGLQAINQELVRQIGDLQSQNEAQAIQIAELQAKTDVTEAIQPISDALRSHDERAMSRNEHILTVLEMIAARMGPENGGRWE